MTRGDVIYQILSEVTGHTKEHVAEMFNLFRQAFPGKDRFDDELSDEEAEAMLTTLRAEKPGILNWLLEGKRRAEAKIARRSS